jgi:NitT/TauT family transport system permease protein
MINAVPKIAIAPLLLIWLGFGIASKVVVAFLISFFPIVIQTGVGLRTVEPELHDLARSLHATWFRTFRKIDLPHALPDLFAGLKVGVTLAVTGAIVGEFLSADKGLGFLLQSAVSQQITELAFAVVFVIAATSIGLFAVVAAMERILVPWSRERST